MSKKGRKQERVEEPRPAEPEQLVKRGRQLDDEAVRHKSSGHKKVTADKWNQ